MAFRTDVLRKLGGFDQALGAGVPAEGGEDLYALILVAWRGYAVGPEPGAAVRSMVAGYLEKVRRRPQATAVSAPSDDDSSQSLVRELARPEIRGIPCGPFAYLRGRLRWLS